MPLLSPDKASSPRRRILIFGLSCAFLLALTCYLYQAVLLPFILALLLYFLLTPVVEYFSKFRIPRVLIIITIIFLVCLLIAIVFAYFVPIIYAEVFSLLQSIPKALIRIREHWLPIVKEHILALDFVDAEQLDVWLGQLNIVPQVTERIQQMIRGIWGLTPGLFEAIVNIVLVPVIAFFLLNTPGSLRKSLATIVPKNLLPHLTSMTHNINTTLRSVLKGQAIVAGILALLYMIGLSVVGLKASIAIGLVAGICRIIPYFDVVVGLLLSSLVFISNFAGWGQVLGVISVFLVVQAIDGMLITPRVMGEKTGLHPLLVILSVLSFGHLFGFLGVLFAIPVIAIVKVVITHLMPIYQKSRLYNL